MRRRASCTELPTAANELPLNRLLDLCRQQEQEDGGEGAGAAAGPIADAGPGSISAGRSCLGAAADWWHSDSPRPLARPSMTGCSHRQASQKA